jgi:hypothetical protein
VRVVSGCTSWGKNWLSQNQLTHVFSWKSQPNLAVSQQACPHLKSQGSYIKKSILKSSDCHPKSKDVIQSGGYQKIHSEIHLKSSDCHPKSKDVLSNP